MKETKSQPITKQMVWEAYKRVKSNRGSAGIDRVSLEDYEADLEDNLYKLWNRLASGSYFPPPVKEVEIPKGDGKMRKLGIPTVSDRVAQMVVKSYLEPKLEGEFHDWSYGYRPGRSAHQAVEAARRNCWYSDWVIDLDIKGFFDELDHGLLHKALEKHNEEKWVTIYVDRWLKAPVVKADGQEQARDKGTPQGGVISPLLANLYLHYSFDRWMEIEFPSIKFERYADDIIVHCVSEKQAQYVLSRIKERLQACKLELHPEKTKIVYCRDGKRRDKTQQPDRFTFLGYEFKSRKCRNSKDGGLFYSFTPGISPKATKRLTGELKKLNIQNRVNQTIEELAGQLNAKVRGWISYYGQFRKSEMWKVFSRLNARLVKWVRKRHKRFGGSWPRAQKALQSMARQHPTLFVHWKEGFTPKVT